MQPILLNEGDLLSAPQSGAQRMAVHGDLPVAMRACDAAVPNSVLQRSMDL
jgi:hypothetical protein